MDFKTFFSDKTTNSKIKTESLAKAILDKEITIDEILVFASLQKDPIKATIIESIENVTKQKPEFITEKNLHFIIESLSEKAPRIKWESSRVIANTIHLFQNKQVDIIPELLKNTSHEGTVVRWSTALAFASILKTDSPESKRIISGIKIIAEKEEKNSIKKIYRAALKGK